MAQTKKKSMMESLTNTASGFLISYLAWKFVVGPAITSDWIKYDDAFIITVFFTFLSVFRNYIVRRVHTNGLSDKLTKLIPAKSKIRLTRREKQKALLEFVLIFVLITVPIIIITKMVI